MVNIATWNVNSVRTRLQHLLEWLRADAPDIVLLQELKCVDEQFPRMEIEDLGYNVAVCGQKTYNGVAILSKFPLEDIARGLGGDDADMQSRYIEAVVTIPKMSGVGCRVSEKPESSDTCHLTPDTKHTVIRVASVYVPNGSEVGSDKYAYKRAFLSRLYAHARQLRTLDEMLVIGGDYNIAPSDGDVANPAAWAGSVLTHDELRADFRKLLGAGLYDAGSVSGIRCQVSDENSPDSRHLTSGIYTWWDYRAGAYQKNDGLRIDHLLLSPQALDRLEGYEVVTRLRGLEKPSDHAPVIGKFA